MLAGSVNVAMLLFAADALQGAGTDSIAAAHRVLAIDLGAVPAAVFALGLLVSSVGSTVVGTHTGARLIKELTPARLGRRGRRAITVVPAVALLVAGVDATRALVWSQLALSFGIGFALIPLVRFTADRSRMGTYANSTIMSAIAWLVVGLILALNLAVLFTSLG